MKKERILKLAKLGVLAEIEKADAKIRKGRKILDDRGLGIVTKVEKSNEEVIEVIEKYTKIKAELDKEFDKINSLIVDLDFV